MSNLIPIQIAEIGGSRVQSVNARELHESLGSKIRFNDWIKRRVKEYGFTDGADFIRFELDAGMEMSRAGGDTQKNVALQSVGYESLGQQGRNEYAITLDMAKQLAMVERTPKGREIRLYFIKCERELREVKAERSGAPPPIPQTYAAALLEAGRLALELEQAQQQIAVDAPKVEFVDRYVNASGSMGFREVCKILKANEREFKHWLFDTKVMYQLGKSMVPYSAHMDAGRFEIKTGNARHGDNDHAFKQARFTPKGIEWIAGEWGKHKARQVR